MTNKLKLADRGLLKTRAFIDGTWVAADNEASFAVTDPATGEVLANVASLGVAETRRAIAAAESAQPARQTKSGKERAGILRTGYDAFMANLEDLAILMTREQGKPLVESRGEIQYAASFVSNEVAPFGGIKQSGIEREGSRYGIDEYLELKYICTQL